MESEATAPEQTAESSASAKRKRPLDETPEELRLLLAKETAKTKLRRILSRPAPLKPFNPLCPHTTPAKCRLHKPPSQQSCQLTHFEPIIRPWTDTSLGYCSYLNLCYGEAMFRGNPSLGEGGPSGRGGVKECRYMHFQVVPSAQPHSFTPDDWPPPIPDIIKRRILAEKSSDVDDTPTRPPAIAQWINCDLRSFDYSVLGQFQVIVADPPWDIHMSLPYGTMTDDEMRRLPLPSLQPPFGILCLWVTGRAMELARELFAVWGYRRVDELVWVKVNQLQRLIRTGRTGHWLNHTCEHLLVAVKIPADFPRDAPIPWDSHPELRTLRKGVDTDVVVAEVRETSRKPDEVYGVIERLAPTGRKLELFGRKHNTRPGWLTLGNQLGSSQVSETDLHERLLARYPTQECRLVA